MTPTKGEKRTRRRGSELEDALLAAAWEVLLEGGYSGFTFEAIADRAETSRAVLYRRWPQRRLLLEDALRRVWVSIDIPDTGDLRADALALLRTLSDTRGALMIALVQHLSDYYRETGSTLTDLRRTIGVSEREHPFETIAERAFGRGELEKLPEAQRILALPLDLLRHDMLLTGGPLPDEALIEIIDDIWLPLLTS